MATVLISMKTRIRVNKMGSAGTSSKLILTNKFVTLSPWIAPSSVYAIFNKVLGKFEALKIRLHSWSNVESSKNQTKIAIRISIESPANMHIAKHITNVGMFRMVFRHEENVFTLCSFRGFITYATATAVARKEIIFSLQNTNVRRFTDSIRLPCFDAYSCHNFSCYCSSATVSSIIILFRLHCFCLWLTQPCAFSSMQ